MVPYVASSTRVLTYHSLLHHYSRRANYYVTRTWYQPYYSILLSFYLLTIVRTEGSMYTVDRTSLHHNIVPAVEICRVRVYCIYFSEKNSFIPFAKNSQKKSLVPPIMNFQQASGPSKCFNMKGLSSSGSHDVFYIRSYVVWCFYVRTLKY